MILSAVTVLLGFPLIALAQNDAPRFTLAYPNQCVPPCGQTSCYGPRNGTALSRIPIPLPPATFPLDVSVGSESLPMNFSVALTMTENPNVITTGNGSFVLCFTLGDRYLRGDNPPLEEGQNGTIGVFFSNEYGTTAQCADIVLVSADSYSPPDWVNCTNITTRTSCAEQAVLAGGGVGIAAVVGAVLAVGGVGGLIF
ncbi:hypothetical protein JCM8547_008948 [Rhodosporidiobolus lusitaniae]